MLRNEGKILLSILLASIIFVSGCVGGGNKEISACASFSDDEKVQCENEEAEKVVSNWLEGIQQKDWNTVFSHIVNANGEPVSEDYKNKVINSYLKQVFFTSFEVKKVRDIEAEDLDNFPQFQFPAKLIPTDGKYVDYVLIREDGSIEKSFILVLRSKGVFVISTGDSGKIEIPEITDKYSSLEECREWRSKDFKKTDECYTEFALKNKDASICDKVVSDQGKEDCKQYIEIIS